MRRRPPDPSKCLCGALATDRWGIMCGKCRAKYDQEHRRDFREVDALIAAHLDALRRKPRRAKLLNATVPGNAENTEGE